MLLPIEIKNIRIAELDTLTPEEVEQYANVLKYLNPVPNVGKYKARDLYEMEFAEVTNIRMAVKDERFFDAMSIYYKIPMIFLLKKKLIEYSHALNHMVKELNILIEREITVLSREPDQDWVASGVKELDKFGALNVLDQLGQQFGKAPTEVETWTYGLVFGLLWKRSVEADINERYREITKNKK